jgi:hypothetical protein
MVEESEEIQLEHQTQAQLQGNRAHYNYEPPVTGSLDVAPDVEPQESC